MRNKLSFLGNYKRSFFNENPKRHTFSSRGILDFKSKYFVPCLRILLVKEGQLTANVFDNFSINSK